MVHVLQYHGESSWKTYKLRLFIVGRCHAFHHIFSSSLFGSLVSAVSRGNKQTLLVQTLKSRRNAGVNVLSNHAAVEKNNKPLQEKRQMLFI